MGFLELSCLSCTSLWQTWTSCRVTAVKSTFWSPANQEANAKQMAQKKASSSRCLGFPFGMWNIAQHITGYLASIWFSISKTMKDISGVDTSAFCTRQASGPQGWGFQWKSESFLTRCFFHGPLAAPRIAVKSIEAFLGILRSPCELVYRPPVILQHHLLSRSISWHH